MSVKLPEKVDQKDEAAPQDGEQNELPPVDGERQTETTPESKISEAEARAHKAEIELAEARGRMSALSEKKQEPQPASQEDQQYERTKGIIMNDVTSLDDETFVKKYNMDKSGVRLHYMEFDRSRDSQRTQSEMAQMRVENTLLTKHGATYAKYKADIAEAVSEASLEVRRDPARLEKFMERAFMALSRDEKKEESTTRTEKKGGDGMQRRIVSDFEAPSGNRVEKDASKKVEKDDLEGEDLEVGRHFGIFTKSERKKYEGKYLEMNFGNGVTFKDPNRGFEKVTKA